MLAKVLRSGEPREMWMRTVAGRRRRGRGRGGRGVVGKAPPLIARVIMLSRFSRSAVRVVRPMANVQARNFRSGTFAGFSALRTSLSAGCASRGG